LPKYDYRCSAGHQYEKREGFDAPAVQSCDVCGVEARRVLTPPAIVFKGSGWYATDSRKGSSAASAAPASAADGSSETKAETAADASAESKTAAKTDTKVEKPASSAPSAAAAD
jgi:putative FmdB family regulatory protein